MFRVARALGVVAKSGERKASTATASEPVGLGNTGDSTSGVPWRTVGLGVTVLGFMASSMAFFSDRAHKDNETTRRELREDNEITRRELREDMKASEARVDKRFDGMDKKIDEIKNELKEISGYLRPAPKK